MLECCEKPKIKLISRIINNDFSNRRKDFIYLCFLAVKKTKELWFNVQVKCDHGVMDELQYKFVQSKVFSPFQDIFGLVLTFECTHVSFDKRAGRPDFKMSRFISPCQRSSQDQNVTLKRAWIRLSRVAREWHPSIHDVKSLRDLLKNLLLSRWSGDVIARDWGEIFNAVSQKAARASLWGGWMMVATTLTMFAVGNCFILH